MLRVYLFRLTLETMLRFGFDSLVVRVAIGMRVHFGVFWFRAFRPDSMVCNTGSAVVLGFSGLLPSLVLSF